ncbi:MAG: CpaE family protein [Fimbriimonadaceae bacterium]|nr:CpaE family protein [Alphaproteobacteria bacterium]
MTDLAYDMAQEPEFSGPGAEENDAAANAASGEAFVAPVPRITIQAFCETPDVAATLDEASKDRRLARAHFTVQMGGVNAAIAFYGDAPTPNLIIIESVLESHAINDDLARLANVCDSGTRVIVIGHINDVQLYRNLINNGVSEYLIAPIAPMSVMNTISSLYQDPDADPIGRVIAFIGAKGGVGSSTIAHNTGFGIAQTYNSDVVIADMDLPFGTAALDFNQDPHQGIAEAVFSPDRLDAVLLERLLAKCDDHVSLFAAPSTLDRVYDFDSKAFEPVLDLVRMNVPYVVLDVPHVWTGWSKAVLMNADEIVITAAPDLANMRNAKNIVDLLKQGRVNDRPPHIVLNQVGMPKRPEIGVKDFSEALSLTPSAIIPFEPELFGDAANNGQMIQEISANAKPMEAFHHLAAVLSGRGEVKPAKQSILAPIMDRLKRKKG